MKIVLFCGGMGTRLKEYSDTIPKPLVEIGNRPIIWHLMKYYAYYGHSDFILCLGYKSEYIKDYFLNQGTRLAKNLMCSDDGPALSPYDTDIQDWNITFAETGLESNIGSRLLAVEKYLKGESVFMANYCDGLTDLVLPEYLEHFRYHGKTASFLAVKPSQSFHVIKMEQGSRVVKIQPAIESDVLINGGYFVFTPEIFEYLREGQDLVEEPFCRLIVQDQLIAYRHPGFWACMDTFKDKLKFDELYQSGVMPWAIWESKPNDSLESALSLASAGVVSSQ